MNVISIDPSKKCTGIFKKINGIEISTRIENKPTEDNRIVLQTIYNLLKYELTENQIDFGLIEGYGYNPGNKRGMLLMAEIGGVIRLLFQQKRIPLIVIPIQTWKALTIRGINKNKNREVYFTKILERYGRQFNTTDEADAFLIYYSAVLIVKKTGDLTPAMEKIKHELDKIIVDHKKTLQKDIKCGKL